MNPLNPTLTAHAITITLQYATQRRAVTPFIFTQAVTHCIPAEERESVLRALKTELGMDPVDWLGIQNKNPRTQHTKTLQTNELQSLFRHTLATLTPGE